MAPIVIAMTYWNTVVRRADEEGLHRFYITYDEDCSEYNADGFNFTFCYFGYMGVNLVEEMMYYGGLDAVLQYFIICIRPDKIIFQEKIVNIDNILLNLQNF